MNFGSSSLIRSSATAHFQRYRQLRSHWKPTISFEMDDHLMDLRVATALLHDWISIKSSEHGRHTVKHHVISCSLLDMLCHGLIPCPLMIIPWKSGLLFAHHLLQEARTHQDSIGNDDGCQNRHLDTYLSGPDCWFDIARDRELQATYVQIGKSANIHFGYSWAP